VNGQQDYHVHTRFSCDSEAEMAAACEVAIARGMSEIAFTDHADFDPLDACYEYLRPAAYLAEIVLPTKDKDKKPANQPAKTKPPKNKKP